MNDETYKVCAILLNNALRDLTDRGFFDRMIADVDDWRSINDFCDTIERTANE